MIVHREDGELDAGTETNINLNHQVYYHFLGTDQSEDILCWKDPEHPKYTFGAGVTEDGKVSCCLINEFFLVKLSLYIFKSIVLFSGSYIV